MWWLGRLFMPTSALLALSKRNTARFIEIVTRALRDVLSLDADGDAPVYPADQWVQQEAPQPGGRGGSVRRALQPRQSPRDPALYPGDGGGPDRSHLVAGRAALGRA